MEMDHKKSEDQKLIVLHDSILPKYRGFIPLVNSLLTRNQKLELQHYLQQINMMKEKLLLKNQLK